MFRIYIRLDLTVFEVQDFSGLRSGFYQGNIEEKCKRKLTEWGSNPRLLNFDSVGQSPEREIEKTWVRFHLGTFRLTIFVKCFSFEKPCFV